MPKLQKEKKPLYNFRSGNYGKGYHGEVFKKHRGDKKAADRAYHETAQRVMKHVGEKNPRAVQHYLDSVHGRFLRGRENKSAYIKLDYARFKKAYKPENFYTEETMSKENLNVADEEVTEAESINPEVAVLFESIVENKPHTAKEILDKILSDKLSDHLDAYKIALAKRMFGEEVDDENEDDEELSEEDIEEVLNNLSDEELDEIIDSLDENELDEEQLDEISKDTLKSYIKKALLNKEKDAKTLNKWKSAKTNYKWNHSSALSTRERYKAHGINADHITKTVKGSKRNLDRATSRVNKLSLRAKNREVGVEKALNKLSEELE